MILRRLLRLATATSLGRALAKRSPQWMAITLAIALVRFVVRSRGESEATTTAPRVT